jgi:hypothetical protein
LAFVAPASCQAVLPLANISACVSARLLVCGTIWGGHKCDRSLNLELGLLLVSPAFILYLIFFHFSTTLLARLFKMHYSYLITLFATTVLAGPIGTPSREN